MLETARLAGFFAAHGMWSVSDGGQLIPMLGCEQADGERSMARFVGLEGPQTGLQALQRNEQGAVRAVLVVDGYVHLDSGKTDALIVEAVDYSAGEASIKVAIPYRPQASPHGFAVHRPKFLELNGVEAGDYDALGEAFFQGVDAHEQAAAIWNASYDPSI